MVRGFFPRPLHRGVSADLDFVAGEVYVLNDGGEVDLDLGNYERYLNVTLTRDNNITTGKIYREVIEKEVGRQFSHHWLDIY